MPTIGWSEMLMLALVAIVVVGPKELPRLMRVVGHWMGKARSAAREFQRAFDEMARESEIEEMRHQMDDMRSQTAFPDPEDMDEEREPESPARTAAGNVAHRKPAGNEPGEARLSDGEGAEEPESRPVPSH